MTTARTTARTAAQTTARTTAVAVVAVVALPGCGTNGGGDGAAPAAGEHSGGHSSKHSREHNKDTTGSTSGAADGAAVGAGAAFGHVHGIGVDPSNGAVYVASHLGVFRVDEDQRSAQRIADRYQDTMAFTVIGPGHFLASGHPDLREDLPTSLGLIESVDAARTWMPVSLAGEADFHALEVAGGRTWGYDSLSGQLLVSADRTTWRKVDNTPLIDIAAPDADPDAGPSGDSTASSDSTGVGRLLATTTDGQVVAYELTADSDHAQTPELLGGPPLGFLDYAGSQAVVGLGADSTVYVSDDDGATWTQSGQAPGQPQALQATEEGWYVATDRGLYRSTDDGQTWAELVANT